MVIQGDKNSLNLFRWSPQKLNFRALLRELIFMNYLGPLATDFIYDFRTEDLHKIIPHSSLKHVLISG